MVFLSGFENQKKIRKLKGLEPPALAVDVAFDVGVDVAVVVDLPVCRKKLAA
jgi:hypothetical protein